MIEKFLLLIVFGVFTINCYGQGVNGYAGVSNISGTTITLSGVDESDDSFEDSEYIIIMQMQDNVIGNTSNSSSFGDLGNIESAGLYEIRKIISHVEVAGTPTTITIESATSNIYHFNTNSTVQIITFPELGSPDYTTVADISATSWDGVKGGIVAFQVEGNLTLAHNIDADEAGFRGAASDINSTLGGCRSTVYIAANTQYALKGEGIFKNTNTSHVASKGKMLNGGGGGSSHNGAGGGGGNYSAGGNGGVGWGCKNSATLTAGGIGGLALSTQITASRFFMGGSGGAGERNNNWNTAGGNGGGIVLIKANQILTTGSCTGGKSITVNGETTINIGNDGAGGSGAGGTIFLNVNSWNVSAGCPLTISANGGNGGSSVSSGIHGGGGGGGQGTVIYANIEPTTNITTSTIPGNGGCSNSSNPCNAVAGGGGGTSGGGVVDVVGTGPLPVELVNFAVSLINNEYVNIHWVTASETDNAYFSVLKSNKSTDWEEIERIEADGNSYQLKKYSVEHLNPSIGTNYYVLKQVDIDGRITLSDIQSVDVKEQYLTTKIFPNPASTEAVLKGIEFDEVSEIKLFSIIGEEVLCPIYRLNNEIHLVTKDLLNGVYIVQISKNGMDVNTEKLIVKH